MHWFLLCARIVNSRVSIDWQSPIVNWSKLANWRGAPHQHGKVYLGTWYLGNANAWDCCMLLAYSSFVAQIGITGDRALALAKFREREMKGRRIILVLKLDATCPNCYVGAMNGRNLRSHLLTKDTDGILMSFQGV
ncbi:predicted protein [Sclerotinia sclerotiorum 1980 UF-70]|uniref:Uncharacterized protein n=1 Tax=Sclerotinia sclerotiorum (strain ATCC 18683 / 1980 / Ss-1) TaxID=665079 RepID=A7EK58_SCLS1|nr:predicted protein [Sclerotinia sclerotiorum 1980 UF-70]EDO03224.1 predicted protein [Sclerotinia sclerotiorum 1980 UF-70]